MHVKSVREKLDRRVLNLRAIQRLLADPDFEITFDRADDFQSARLDLLIKEASVQGVKDWIKNLHPDEVAYMSHRKLSELGRKENIPGWSRLSREQLITILKDKGYV